MATNRRRDADAVRIGVLVRALLVCAVIAGLGIGYVRQNAEQLSMGRRISELEQRRERLTRTLEAQRTTLSMLVSRPQLLARVERFKLSLTNATPGQRLYVAVPGAALASRAIVANGVPAGGNGGVGPSAPVATLGNGR
jgi:hypothetical protein